jgi:glycosyltransferase involved in cell wall biosynthesis
MKIALVHDMLTQYGGGEKVLKALSEKYPNAPIFTLIYDEKKLGHIFPKERIRTSFLQKMPLANERYKWYLPLMPHAIESLDLNGYDLVISSSSAFSKGVITGPTSTHICYCHTPTRYLWIDSQEYIRKLKYNNIIKKIISLFLTRLRLWDSLSVNRVDKFIANSNNVKHRIKKYYGQDSKVIYPPVETNNFMISKEKGDYFLAGGRLVPYKKFDLIIDTFNKLNIPLKIFGVGPEIENLKRKANKNIEFLEFATEKEKISLYSRAQAFIHPQEEDFGITLVEAMASGTPVIAYKAGGSKESLNENISGEFFHEQTWESLADKIINFNKNKYSSELIKQEAERFNVQEFKKRIDNLVCNC